jgi:hypothetical protein
MYVPRYWARVDESATGADGQPYRLRPWGWSDESVEEALERARHRFLEIRNRLAQGEDFEGPYLYESTPIREEIIRSIGGEGQALVTRNRYGALVLNTARVPFVDIDVVSPRAGLFSRLMGALRGVRAEDPPDPALDRIRSCCAQQPTRSFRIYRTKAGYRVLATDLLLDPSSDEAEAFLGAFESDPSFIKLCRVQKSFRARLTPKPWRCGCRPPQDRFPFEEAGAAERVGKWLRNYEQASQRYASCRFIETVGTRSESSEATAIRQEHDRVTRADSDLPLA